MDFEKIEKVFKEYVNTFDWDNEKIKLKYYHTLEVASISYEIAMRMGLSNEDKSLAKLIGYLHDIGRRINHNNHPIEGYKYLKFGNILLNEAVKSCVAVCIVGE